MADENLSVLISLVDEISKPLGNIATELQSFGKTAQEAGSVASGALSLLGTAAVAGVAIEGLREIAKAGIEAQGSLHDLSVSIKSTGQDVERWRGQLLDTVSALRESTQFDDTDIRRGLTSLIQFTGNLEVAERALASAADLAAARHTSLAQASEALARGLEGVGRGLRSYGIILTEHEQQMLKVMDETQRLDFLQGKIEQHFGGAATAALETFDGQWAHLKSTLHEFLETAGGPLAEWATNFLSFLNSAADGLKTVAGYMGTVGERLGYMSKDSGVGSLAGFGANRFGGYGASGSWTLDIPPEARAALAMMQAEIAQGIAHPAEKWKSQLDKLADAINDIEKNWQHAKAAGMSFDAFVLNNAEHLQKLAQAAGNGGVSIDGLAKSLFRAADALRQIPQKTSLEDLLNAKAFQGTFPGALMTLVGPVSLDTGQLDPRAARANQQALDDFEKQAINTNQQIENERLQQEIRNAKLIAAFYEQNVIQPFADAFADLALTGGKNLGKIFTAELGKGAKDAGAALLEALRGGAGGEITPNAVMGQSGYFVGAGYNYNGQTYGSFAEAYTARNQQNLQFAQYGSAAMQLAGFGYQAAQGMSPIQGALSGLSVGSSIGTAIGGTVGGLSAGAFGGLIGVFVGALVAALTEAMPQIQTYARPVIKNGVAGLVDLAGDILSDPATQREWIGKVQHAWDQFTNGYVQIALNAPEAIRQSVLPQIAQVLQHITTGQFIGGIAPLSPGGLTFPGEFGTGYNGPSGAGGGGYLNAQQWTNAMQGWINQSLPQSIMEQFRPALASMFEGMGLTVDKFNEIWKRAENMDPQAALQYLTDYADVVGTMQDLLRKIAQPINVGGGGGLYADVLKQSSESYAQQLADTDKKIHELAQGIQLLTGQAQIDAAKQLNQLIQQRYDQERQMVQQIVNMIESARQTLASDIFGLQLQGKSPQQQYALYATHLTELEGSLGTATTADQASRIYQQIRSTILSMAGLFPGDQSINAWAQQELSQEFGVFQDAMDRFGQTIDQVNTQFQNQMQPVVDLFTSTTQDFSVDLSAASTSVGEMDSAAKSAAVSLRELADAANAFTSTLQSSGFVQSTRTRRQAA